MVSNEAQIDSGRGELTVPVFCTTVVDVGVYVEVMVVVELFGTT